jgi:dihydroorotase
MYVDGKVSYGDLIVVDGKISEVLNGGYKGDEFGGEVVDCRGKLILPGLIDVHVHFREPGHGHKEDWATGSRAAATGGVTTVIDMPNNNPPVITKEDFENKERLIGDRSVVNYGLYMGYNGENVAEINAVKGARGVKIYCAHSTGNMGISDEYLERAFVEIDKDKLLLFHCEDEECMAVKEREYREKYNEDLEVWMHSEIRSANCALKMVRRVMELVEKYHRGVHICHVSTAAEIDLINKYRKFGVTCEVAPHHLFLSTDDYEHLGSLVKMNPPMRDRESVFDLWKCVKAEMVDIIATDHAPHTLEEKSLPFPGCPSGVPGVEMMLPLLLNMVNDDGLDISEVVRMCCEHPAKIFGFEKKGSLRAGFDADLVVVDMELERKVERENVVSKCGWSPYEGVVLKGWPVMTFVAGENVSEVSSTLLKD